MYREGNTLVFRHMHRYPHRQLLPVTFSTRPRLLFLLLFAIAFPAAVLGQDKATPVRQNPTIDPMLVAAGFLDSHPDLLYRSRGLDAYGEKDHKKAFREFKRAALYSDKPSQAIVGEMLWIGLGTAMDRGLAYVWMDLAAERGYTSFATKRDMYWQQLNAVERARAESEGTAIRAEYSDAAAAPRLNAVLLRERRKMTGSRVGTASNPMRIVVPGVGTIDGSQYYDPKYWEPELYRRWHNSIWTDLKIGRVNVGEVEQVRQPGPLESTPVDDRDGTSDPATKPR